MAARRAAWSADRVATTTSGHVGASATICAPFGVDHLRPGPRLIALQLQLSCCCVGFWYSVTILAILGCHELGHYFACRYYDVDASLPFFLPVPPFC